MGLFGKILGNIAGGLGSKFLPLPGVNGGEIGSTIGNLLPFANGGRVPGKRGKPKVILAHGSEFILPVGVQPTAFQKKEVAKRKAAAKKKNAKKK